MACDVKLKPSCPLRVLQWRLMFQPQQFSTTSALGLRVMLMSTKPCGLWKPGQFQQPTFPRTAGCGWPTGGPKGVIFLLTLVETSAWNCSLRLQLQSSQEQYVLNGILLTCIIHSLYYITHFINPINMKVLEGNFLALITDFKCKDKWVNLFFINSLNKQSVNCSVFVSVICLKGGETVVDTVRENSLIEMTPIAWDSGGWSKRTQCHLWDFLPHQDKNSFLPRQFFQDSILRSELERGSERGALRDAACQSYHCLVHWDDRTGSTMKMVSVKGKGPVGCWLSECCRCFSHSPPTRWCFDVFLAKPAAVMGPAELTALSSSALARGNRETSNSPFITFCWAKKWHGRNFVFHLLREILPHHASRSDWCLEDVSD